MKLTLADVVSGLKKKLKLSKAVQCSKCWGSGTMSTASIKKCSVCSGSGERTRTVNTVMGKMQVPYKCSACNGSGREQKADCPDCRGKGIVQGEDIFGFTVPAGQHDGAQLLFKGKGSAGERGGIAGDLIIQIEVDKTHPFIIEGRDLVYKLNVSIPDAVLGVKVEVPTIEGAVKFDIPAGSESGKQFRLRGKGLPSTTNLVRGDIRIEINVFMPTSLSTEERRMMLTLKDSNNFKPPYK